MGNGNGFFGVGKGKAAQMKSAIDKATNDALLNVIPVQIGCGSWECRCGTKHSVPYRIVGKAGSVQGRALPAPRSLGTVAGPALANLLALAGIKDVWARTFGSTDTLSSLANAVYDAFSKSRGLERVRIWRMTSLLVVNLHGLINTRDEVRTGAHRARDRQALRGDGGRRGPLDRGHAPPLQGLRRLEQAGRRPPRAAPEGQGTGQQLQDARRRVPEVSWGTRTTRTSPRR